MSRAFWITVLAAVAVSSPAHSQVTDFVPVTHETLVNPSPNDWLMYSRTYDAQRFSPLRQIDRSNVARLEPVFSITFDSGTLESIPLVYNGVMYLVLPGAAVQAIDARDGTVLWEHRRTPVSSRSKVLGIFEDMVYYTAPDGLVALDARTGAVRWETPYTGGPTSGAIVIEGKVMTGRTCPQTRDDCYIAAHDARTGEEVWRFYTTAGDDDPHGDTWAGLPESERIAAPWGLPGGYDPELRQVYWGIANPVPYTRLERHGDRHAIPNYSPAELYSNSTVALDPDSGELIWYYQHLPGDDWDQDYAHERTLARIPLAPDPAHVKWINPALTPGEPRDVAVMVGEGGGVFVMDRRNGEFLWATPFPFDTPDFLISHIDGETGRVHLNEAAMFDNPGDRRIICFYNTRSYWPTAYHPRLHSLYVPYIDNCLDMTAYGPRFGVLHEERSLDELSGLARIDLVTGRIDRIFYGRAPSNGAALVSAGDLVFWGDLDHRIRAFDAESGDVLWETTLDGPVQNSTITYAVDGRQYVAVLTGEGILTGRLIEQAGINPNRGHNSLTVFALPEDG